MNGARSTQLVVLWVVAASVLGTACSSTGSSTGTSTGAPGSGSSGRSAGAVAGTRPQGGRLDPIEAVPPAPLGGDPSKECPGAYAQTRPVEGLNVRFESASQSRSFHVLKPTNGARGPRPLFLAFTGTVQEERAFLTQSKLDLLVKDGWIVVAPVRNNNGILWPPWDAMRTPPIADRPNPDLDFFVSLVRCVGAHEEVDKNRIYTGGISIGGTMTNYVLRRESELFAGGIVGSGNFLTTEPSQPEPLQDMVVIVAWGGKNDHWSGCSDGAMGSAADASAQGGKTCVGSISFVEDASHASQFYASQPGVDQVACSMELGHIWLTPATGYMAAALLARPKGMPGPYVLPTDPSQPAGLSCNTEPFVLEDVQPGG